MNYIFTFGLIIFFTVFSFMLGQGYERLGFVKKLGKDKVCELYKNDDIMSVPFACLKH